MGEILMLVQSSGTEKKMKHEKSCGALVLHKNSDNTLNILLLRHRHGGHWSFPKGHVEEGETETETALREVYEETGLRIFIYDGFRHCVQYSPKPGTTKEVVYFVGESGNEKFVRQEEEISEICWMTLKDALKAVTFNNDRKLLMLVSEFIEGKI